MLIDISGPFQISEFWLCAPSTLDVYGLQCQLTGMQRDRVSSEEQCGTHVSVDYSKAVKPFISAVISFSVFWGGACGVAIATHALGFGASEPAEIDLLCPRDRAFCFHLRRLDQWF